LKAFRAELTPAEISQSLKQRPALVISTAALSSTHDDVLIAAMTSRVPPALASDEFLIPAGDLTTCGLPKASILSLSKLAALHHQPVVKRIGTLPAMAQLLANMRQLF
jgi:mRNA-degrading endonuclease toxin of MazEF toxin-antitoxin module